MKISKRYAIGIPILIVMALAVSSYYFFRDIQVYLTGNQSEFSEIRLRYRWWIISHFSFASLTLFLGPLQFVPQIRNNYLRFHRLSGKLYIIGSIISALTVYVLLVTTYSLPGAIPSLGLLATIWLFTTISAYVAIKRKNVQRHKEFMIRSYVCGLAFVFIRLLPEINSVTGIFEFIEDDHLRRTVYEWVCWVYPLIFLEFWLVWRKQLLKL